MLLSCVTWSRFCVVIDGFLSLNSDFLVFRKHFTHFAIWYVHPHPQFTIGLLPTCRETTVTFKHCSKHLPKYFYRQGIYFAHRLIPPFVLMDYCNNERQPAVVLSVLFLCLVSQRPWRWSERARSWKRRTISVSPAATDTAWVFTAVPCCLSQWERLKDDGWHYCASSLKQGRYTESLFNHQVTRLLHRENLFELT